MLTINEALPHFVASAEVETLARIRTPGVNLCLWERAPRPAIASLLARLMGSCPKLAIDATLLAEETLSASADSVLRRYEMDFAFPLWLEDIRHLTELFREISGATAVRLRLERVTDPGCTAFHTDTLEFRLLCTYHGRGTQWLEHDNLRRSELGMRGRSLEEANGAIVIDDARIRTVPAWHVMIFKGRACAGEEDNALVHRSFPVCCPDHARLVLCLDLPRDHANAC